jgi:hypothetical protein
MKSKRRIEKKPWTHIQIGMDETKKKKKNSNPSMKPTLSSLMHKRKLAMINSAQLNEETVDLVVWEDLILGI